MIDANLILDGTAPNVGAALTATRVSGNVIDLLIDRDAGVGDALELHVLVTTTFAAGGAATLQISMQSGDDPTAASNYDLILSPVIPVASLVAGKEVFRYILPMYQENEVTGLGHPGRYINLKYTVSTGPFTAGALMAYVTAGMDRDTQQSYQYKRGYSIDA